MAVIHFGLLPTALCLAYKSTDTAAVFGIIGNIYFEILHIAVFKGEIRILLHDG